MARRVNGYKHLSGNPQNIKHRLVLYVKVKLTIVRKCDKILNRSLWGFIKHTKRDSALNGYLKATKQCLSYQEIA